MKNLIELTKNLNIIETINFDNINVEGITYNSLEVKENYIFCALLGTATDGNKFIPQAISKGAKVIVSETTPTGNIPDNVTFIIVEDARKTMALLANKFYDFQNNRTKIIGVTGTNGKTTITFLISYLLKQLGFSTAIIGTTGIYLKDENIPATHTTPESVKLYELINKINSLGIDYIVMEVSSHSLMQKRVYGIDFEIAVFTNLTSDHLDYHKTMENYADAKKILFDSLKPAALAIVNSDDSFSDYITKNLNSNQVIKVGTKSDSNYVIQSPKSDINGVSFDLFISKLNRHIRFNSNLIGDFNISNLALSIVSVANLGFDITKLAEFTTNITAAPGRMELIKLKNGSIGVVDYAHTPDALEKAIKTLRNLKNGGDLITVFGCGGDRDKSKRPVMGRIASILSDKVIITNDNPRSENPDTIIQEIIQGIDKSFIHKVEIIPDRAYAINKAISLSNTGDIVLIAGKGHEKYQIFGTEKIYFDDREELRKYGLKG